MILYLIPLFISICAAIQYDIGGHKDVGRKVIWYVLFTYLVLFMGLRYMVGGDTQNYMLSFEEMPDLFHWEFSLEDNYQPFYTFLCSLAKTIYPDFFVFQLLHALILNSCIFYFISRNTEYRFTALTFCFIFYYLYFSTEVLREGLAVFVFVLNYKNFEKGNWLKYYIGVAIACMFHISAILLIVFPFLKWLKLDWRFACLLIISIFVFFKLSSFFTLFEDLEKVSLKLSAYEDSSKYFSSGIGVVMNLLRLCRYTIVPICIYSWAKYILGIKPKYENMVCIYAVFGIGIWFNPIMFERFTNYITPLYMLALADIIVPCFKRCAANIHKLAAALFCVVLFIVYGSYHIQYRLYKMWIPYYSIFNPQYVEGRDNFRMK